MRLRMTERDWTRFSIDSNTASDVWADTAYRSTKNEDMLTRRGSVSRIHRKKPKSRPMPERTRIANARKSRVRSAVEHVFAHQKGPMGLVIRTIGMARAKVKIGMANLAYNVPRFVWLQRKHVIARGKRALGARLAAHPRLWNAPARGANASKPDSATIPFEKSSCWRSPTSKGAFQQPLYIDDALYLFCRLCRANINTRSR